MSEHLPVVPVSTAIVSDLYWVPTDEVFSAVPAHRVRDCFTVKAKHQVYGKRSTKIVPLPIWREDASRPGMIGVPIAEGEKYFPADDLREDLSDGHAFDSFTRRADPEHPMAAPGQAEFMRLAESALENNYTSLFKADTGTGKTVVSLDQAARIGRNMIVLVPTTVLMHQWIEQAQNILGVPRARIGIVQGDKCQFGPEKHITVAMMKSLAMRRYPDEFYRAFGIVCVDEVHNTGAEMLSRTQGLFNARYKFALSATNDRRDGADRVYHAYFGQPAFQRNMPAIPTTLTTLTYQGPRVGGYGPTQVAQRLSNDPERNHMIAGIAARWYDEGHNILIVSAFVEHCYYLRDYLLAMGVPEDHVGVFVASSPSRGKYRKEPPPKQDYLDWCKKEPPIIVATYGMFKEGTDVPRLDRGIDATPRGDMRQLLGRIRRKHPGKTSAEWVTIRDRNTPALEGLYHARVRSLRGLRNITFRKGELHEYLP